MKKETERPAKNHTPCCIFPPDGYVFDTYTQGQRKFIDTVRSSDINTALEWLKAEQGNEDFSCSGRLSFCWSGEEESYLFELSEKEDLGDAIRVDCKSCSCDICNLKVGTTYYWRINGGETHVFKTLQNDWRFISIDGLKNIRDLGGRGIKQGLIYRGSEVHGGTFRITEAGARTLRDELLMKTILDLRIEWLGKYGDSSPVEGVALKQIPYRPYIEIFEEKHRLEIKEIMKFLSDEKNYPVYFHCMGGADRTGMIAIYLEALAGDSPEDIFLDYELTSLAKIYNPEKLVSDNYYRIHTASYFSDFLTELEKCAPGESFNAQIKAFLLESGVSKECLDKVISIVKK